MRLACKFEELDDGTRAYLHDVRTRKGKDTPGIFIATGTMRPMLAMMIGPTTALVLLVISFASTKDAWAIAMLQTAALLIGGWTVFYAFRRWFAGRSKIYGGVFVYFDPLHAYEVAGEKITITGLRTVHGVNPFQNPARVLFEFKGDREEVVPVPSMKEADLVSDYYEAMETLESSKKSVWSNVTSAELGAAAKYCVEEDESPRDVNDLRLDIEEIPSDPTKAKKAGFGLLPHLIILIASSAVFLVSWQANKPLNDDAAFAHAKENGAPGLRGYLLDDRNTRHRDEAKVLLAAAYDPAIHKLETAPKANNPKAREGMIELVKSLKTSDSPVVSLEVIETPNPENVAGGTGSTTRATKLRTEMADALARGVDPKLIAFAPAAEGAKSHITIRFQFRQPKQDNPNLFVNGYVADIEIEIRTDIAAPPVVVAKWVEDLNTLTVLNAWELDTRGVEELKLRLSRELVGVFVIAPPVIVEPLEDF